MPRSWNQAQPAQKFDLYGDAEIDNGTYVKSSADFDVEIPDHFRPENGQF